MRTIAQGQEREPPLELALSRQRYRPTLGFIKHLVSGGPLSGLDVGCGFQAQFVRIANQIPGAHFQGCDIAVDPANPDLFTMNLAAPVPLGRTFDLITLHAVLEHLAQPASVLAFLATLVKPGGYLVLTMPTPLARFVLEFLAYRLNLISRREINDHKHYWNKKRFADLLAGRPLPFKLVQHRYYQLGFNNWVLLEKSA
jgi:SAM-dependent methyltransferase